MSSTTDPHPLNAADAERSAARLADLQLGLTAGDPVDRRNWRAKAERRVAALEEDADWLGLMPHEEAELEQLRSMLADVNARLAGPIHG